MLRLLVDENLPRSLTESLRKAGHKVWDIRELGLRGSSDDQVFRQAQELGATLLSAMPSGSHRQAILESWW